jgi:signal transduction histidine kinase
MHSDEQAATPVPDALDVTCARRDAILVALGVAVIAIVGGGAALGASTRGAVELSGRITQATAIAGLAVAAFGAILLEIQHRRAERRIEGFRAANGDLRDTAVRKDEFLASVSHELRTPLNVVLGYIDLLLDNSFGPLEPAQRDILHRITKNASNLSHLINDLVDLSRIEAGRMRIEMEVVDLEPLFADLTAVMQVLLAGHDVTFRAEIVPGCDHLHADPDRLKQIVSNLLVNAVKFTERGSITLLATPGRGDRVVITVTDTGIGIPKDDHQAIFEPFRQVHERERRAPGAGIGLSISSRLAVLMGGSLGVESEPGLGSRFKLELGGPPAEAPPAVFTLRKVS